MADEGNSTATGTDKQAGALSASAAALKGVSDALGRIKTALGADAILIASREK